MAADSGLERRRREGDRHRGPPDSSGQRLDGQIDSGCLGTISKCGTGTGGRRRGPRCRSPLPDGPGTVRADARPASRSPGRSRSRSSSVASASSLALTRDNEARPFTPTAWSRPALPRRPRGGETCTEILIDDGPRDAEPRPSSAVPNGEPLRAANTDPRRRHGREPRRRAGLRLQPLPAAADRAGAAATR